MQIVVLRPDSTPSVFGGPTDSPAPSAVVALRIQTTCNESTLAPGC